MTDLAQAIVDMTAAAKGRTVEWRKLDAASERIGAEIIRPLRSGDSVTVYRTQAGWVAEVGDERSASETVTVSVDRVTWPVPYPVLSAEATTAHRHGANALVIENAVYSDPRTADAIGSRIGRHANLHTTRETYDLHLATGEERLRFCEMAPAIVEAFRRLAEVQAEDFAKGAETVSKTVVR
jgi:hypothetical protein